MGRRAKPWWWEERKGYYAFIRGSRTRLGTSLKEANQTLKDLLNEPVKKASYGMVAVLFDQFLTWTEENRAPKTYRGYKDFLQSFVSRYPRLPVSDLSSAHVTVWLDDQKTWNATTKRNAITALQRGLNWSVKNVGLDRNPIRGMEKPEANRRTAILTLAEFKALLRKVRDRDFRDLLLFGWDVGCRPQEAKRLEDRHVDLDRRRCVIPADEAKGKRTRVFYLATERSVRIMKRRMGNGRIFLNRRGRPWTTSAVRLRFARLEKKLGKCYTQYAFRHTWITRKLLAGVDSHVVATLAGHADTKMIDEVYSHIADDYKFMLAQAQKQITPSSGAASEQKAASAPPNEAGKCKSPDTPESAPPKNESPPDPDGSIAVCR